MDRGVTPEDRQLYASYIASKQPPQNMQPPPAQGFANGGSVIALMQPLKTMIDSVKQFGGLPSPELEPMAEPRPLPDVGGSVPLMSLDMLQPDNLEEPKQPLALGESIVKHLIPGYARGGLVEDEDNMVEYYKRLLTAMKADESHQARRLPKESLPELDYPAPKDKTVRGSPMQRGIIESAEALGVDPVDLATIISYETSGTFDPTKRGPTTKWGQHRGLIQFGNPQAKKYGVDWNNPIGTQLGAEGAVVKYMRDAGVKPGMGILDMYSAVNTGKVGRYGWKDAKAGGAPGTVREKVNNQMKGHRRKAVRLINGKGKVGNYKAGKTPDAFANAPIPTPRPNNQTLIAGRPNVPIADPHKYLESLNYPDTAPAIPAPPKKRPPGNPDAKGMARLAPPPSSRYRDPTKWSPVGNYVARDANRVNPKLRAIMKEAAQTYKSPYKVEAFSGWRPGKGKSRHKGHQSNAIDIRLVDVKTGKVLPNYQDPKYFREYEKFAQHARRTQMKLHPELNDQFRFGGYFGAETNKKGVPVKNKYGSMDLMHFDLSPGAKMAAGSWEGGVNKAHRKFWGVESAGMKNLPPHIQAAAAGHAVKPAAPAPVQNGLNAGLAMGGVSPPPAPPIPNITPTIVPPMVAGNFAPPVAVPPPMPTPNPVPAGGGGGGIGGLIGGIASMIAMSAASSQPTHTEVHQQVPGKPYNVAEMRGSTKKQKDGKPIDKQDDEEDDPLRWLMTL